MARSFNGSTDRIEWANPWDQAGSPVSFSMWIWPDVVTANIYFLNSHASGDASLGSFTLWHFVDGRLLATFRRDTQHTARNSTASMLTTTGWLHAVVTYTGSLALTGIHIYHNGVNVDDVSPGSNNGTGSPISGDGSWAAMGRIYDNTRNADGKLAAIGVWDRVITGPEIASLAAGANPSMIPSGLRFSSDMDGFRSPDDQVSGNPAVFDGTTLFDHPGGLIYPSSAVAIPPSVAAPTTNIDTQQKRMSVVGVGRPWMRSAFPGAKNQAWRQARGAIYAGNPVAAPPAAGGGRNVVLGGGVF